MSEKDCFEGLDDRTLAAMVACFIAHIQKGFIPIKARREVSQTFGHKLEIVDGVIKRLLPKYLLRVVVRRRNLSSNEKKITISYLDSLVKGCCVEEAVNKTAREHKKDPAVIEERLKGILLKVLLDLKPLSHKPPTFD